MLVKTKLICLFLVLLSAPVIFAQNEEVTEDADGSDKKVVNGTPAAPNSRPFVVALQEAFNGVFSQFCGGSLINTQWVLTAAHCFDDMSDTRIKLLSRVKIGALTANTPDRNEVLRNMEEVYIHPLYDSKDPDAFYDIALIKLNEPVKYRSNIQPVTLPNGMLNLNNAEGEVIGWGATTFDGKKASNVLLYGKASVSSSEKCKRFGERHDSRLCLLGGSSACVGDSGGPFVTSVNGKQVQIGIVSIGGKYCKPGDTFMVTSVQYYLDYIQEILTKHK